MPETNGKRPPIDTQALKDAVNLADVVARCGVELRSVGRNLVARCPFHDDHEASLVVNPDRQLWNCFGCQSGGDVLTFLQLKEKLDFRQACARLGEWVGVLPAPPPKVPAQGTSDSPATVPGPTEPLPGGFTRAQLLERVAAIYAERMPAVPSAREYLASRGLESAELARAFRLGVADGTLLKMLPEQGPIREALQLIGVLRSNGKEHFAGCVVVPLEHPDYGVVGLYGRRMLADAKIAHLYLPGPQRGVLNHQALRASREIVIAESVLDALSLWMAGCRDVTCIYGVQGISRDLEELLGRYAIRQVTLCLDGDAAGRSATHRLGGQLMRRGMRCLEVAMPEATDANALLATQGATALQHLLTRARPVQIPDDAPAPMASVAEMPPSDGGMQPTGDGFLYTVDGLTWRVTPRPPFVGRLKVTLRVQHDGHAFLDNLDLYSHRARVALANQMSHRTGMEKDAVERQLLALIDHTEQWVKAQQDEDTEEAPEQKKAPVMSATEREEAVAFLQRPDLVAAILADIEVMGYVGEGNAKLLGYLIGVSRKLDKPLSGIVLSQAGAGKSALTEIVEQLAPPEDVVLYSRMSAQALGYMKRDFLMHKILILEERVGAAESEYAIRVLQSRQRLTQAVVVKDPTTGKMHTRHYEVLGPIAYLETTTNPNINFENATRCLELTLDESEEQTRRIHQLQREARLREGLLRRSQVEAIRRRHHNAQRLLQSVKVEVPYVAHLTFPAQWLRTRRDHERFLSLIEAVTFLHQQQRQRVTLETADGKTVECVVATLADYRLAYQLARDVLRATLHELTRHAQDLWDVAKAMVAEYQAGKKKLEGPVTFTRRELRHRTNWPDRRLREALDELVQMEYVAAMEGSQGKRFFYRLLADVENVPSPLGQLTTPEQLAAVWQDAS